MRKEVAIIVVLFVFLLSIPFLISQTDNTATEDEVSDTIPTDANEDTKISKAYQCLEDKIDGECDSLSTEERIFTSLALGKCSSEIQDDSKYKSDVKATALSVLALDKAGISTSDAEEWLFEQNGTPNDLVWYLQIESSEQTSCSVSYSGGSHSISIGADKKISSNAGSCLSLSEGSYWLRVSPSCYSTDFAVSCDKGFQTNLLFKKTTSSTIHVSEKTTSASAEGTTTETINSVCFKQGGACTYEGSLWSALVLDYLGYDVSDYYPYLITVAEDNPKFLPEAFLYSLIGSSDFRSKLLLKQKSSEFWDESGDKFYDTALALYPLQYEDSTEKTNAKSWLLEPGVQDNNGCWKGNTRNTAFLLYSIWPRGIDIGPDKPKKPDCIDNDGYCMSEINCDGEILSEYSCGTGISKCCSVPIVLRTCSDLGGEECRSGERCVGGTFADSSDSGNDCCVAGRCEENVVEETACAQNFGTCRPFGCESGESEAQFSCTFQDTCCVSDDSPKGIPWWIWVLIILILIVVLLIIFRNKLRPTWFKIKSKFSKSGGLQGRPGGPRPGFPPQGSRGIPMRGPPRRMLPPGARPLFNRGPRPPQRQQGQGEMDSVLKKLKEMGS